MKEVKEVVYTGMFSIEYGSKFKVCKEVYFESCTFKCDFSGMMFKDCVFINCKFTNCVFDDVTFMDCSFDVLISKKILSARNLEIYNCPGISSLGFYDLGTSTRGYDFYLYKGVSSWKIIAGCRHYTFRAALKHWAKKPEETLKVKYAMELAEYIDSKNRKRK